MILWNRNDKQKRNWKGIDETILDQYDYQDRKVKTVTIHPFYSGMETLKNDIAIIHTEEAFKKVKILNQLSSFHPVQNQIN